MGAISTQLCFEVKIHDKVLIKKIHNNTEWSMGIHVK